MKSHGIWYWNEFKHMSRGLIIILLFTIGYTVFMGLFFKGKGHIPFPSSFELILLRLGNMTLYLYPAFLVFSLYLDKRREEYFKTFSHPSILRTKFLVVLSAIILTTALMTVYAFTLNHFRPRADNRVIIMGLISYFCKPFIILCLVTTAWGIMQFVKRNQLIQFILGIVIVIAGFIFYKWIIELGFVSNIYRHFFFTLVIGVVYAFIGIFLYERSG